MFPGPQPPQPGIPGQRFLTLQDLTTRITMLRTQIEQGEQTFLALTQALSAARGTPAEGAALQKVKEAQSINAQRKEYQQRLMVMLQNYQKTQQVAAAAAAASGGGPNPVGAGGMQSAAWNNPAASNAASGQLGETLNQAPGSPFNDNAQGLIPPSQQTANVQAKMLDIPAQDPNTGHAGPQSPVADQTGPDGIEVDRTPPVTVSSKDDRVSGDAHGGAIVG